MIEADPSDFSDDSDYAASQQQKQEPESKRSIAQTDTGKTIMENEPEGAEIVYVKDNVTIHPTQYASERISGRLRLIKQGSSLFMTWIPYKANLQGRNYKGHNSNARLSERDRNLYTIRAVPVMDIRSIRRYTPTFGWQYIIVVLASGLAFPPLYFYNGGVHEFLGTLKEHVVLLRSASDDNLFLVNDFQDPLQRCLSSLEIPRAVSMADGLSTSSLISPDHSAENSERTDYDDPSISQHGGKQRVKVHDPARDLSIQVLEKFSLVTKFARETTSNLINEIQNGSFHADNKKSQNQSLPENIHDEGLGDIESVADTISVPKDPLEIALCRKENHCEEAATRVGNFELVNCQEFDRLTLAWGKPRQPPLGSEEWATFLDVEGRVMDSKALRKRIFCGGIEHSLRKEAWKFLLGFHEYYSTYAEREYLGSAKKSEYETLKQQWKSISPAQAKRFAKFRERKGLIDKDVVRTDRSVSFYDGDRNSNVKLLRDILLTYSFYNFDLGYCQGMSDLLSPILFVMRDESESFWCFAALMERLGPNFNRDQNGMHSQLLALSKLVELLDSPLHNYFKLNDCINYFFCFRWVLIQFKREFEYDKVMRVWEVLWTHHMSEHFHLYICVAILKRHRKKIMGERMDFDTLLKFINELSGQIDLDVTLRDAEALCICAGDNGAACIPPGTPASLPVDTGLLDLQDDI